MQETRKRADRVVRELAREDWQPVSAGAGSKEPCLFTWARVELATPAAHGWRRWLLLVVSATQPGRGSQTGRDGLHLGFAHAGTSLVELVEAFGTCWIVERCLEETKGEVGLDEYEVRTFHGWYRHITLSMVALTFLTVLRAHVGQNTLKKSRSSRSHPQRQKQAILLKLQCRLICRYWFLSALLSCGDCAFTSLAIRHSRLLTIWLGHVGDVRTRHWHGCAITSAGVLSLVIYNCRIYWIALL